MADNKHLTMFHLNYTNYLSRLAHKICQSFSLRKPDCQFLNQCG